MVRKIAPTLDGTRAAWPPELTGPIVRKDRIQGIGPKLRQPVAAEAGSPAAFPPSAATVPVYRSREIGLVPQPSRHWKLASLAAPRMSAVWKVKALPDARSRTSHCSSAKAYHSIATRLTISIASTA